MDSDRLKGIDLHIHSAASDGSLTPSEIVSQAQALSLAAISITDHDTIEGVEQALSVGIPPSVDFITGVEISTKPPAPFPIQGSLHILGYGFNLEHSGLTRILDRLQETRTGRIPLIIDKLNHLGLNVSFAEVSDQVGDGIAGRPHVASVMVERGYAEDINDAFDRYLSKGQPAYVDKYRIDAATVIQEIRDAGGLAVLAHPMLTGLPKASVTELILDLKAMGLAGIEALYPEHTAEETACLKQLAAENDLLLTGGTDFHGSIKPDIQMGKGRGDFHVPYELYEGLRRHAADIASTKM